jgi:hypothetical protein
MRGEAACVHFAEHALDRRVLNLIADSCVLILDPRILTTVYYGDIGATKESSKN